MTDSWSTSYEALTPVSFLLRAATVYPNHVALVDEGESLTYARLFDECHRGAGALAELGVNPGDRVAVLAPNGRLALSAHYSVPMVGGVLVAMNTRLRREEWAYILDHSGAAVLLYDESFVEDVATLAVRTKVSGTQLAAHAERVTPTYRPVTDETSLIALNYTSGTTGRPKGAMYHHRGAYLQALSMAFHAKITPATVHLWTLPMFHCNGWTFTWAVTAAGGTHVNLPRVDAGRMWELVRAYGVDSFNAAPTVLNDFANHPDASRLTTPISVGTGGSPPSPALLARLADLNVSITHLYGLTETFGPSVICEVLPEWQDQAPAELAALRARQGNASVVCAPLRVVSDGADVPADGVTMGEVWLRGNTVTTGYYNDAEATETSYGQGWFRTGDLGVQHPNGQLELRDRAKDVIISGGENISSIEVEQAIARHPAVREVAVVAGPHERWGEVPVAFVELRDGATVTEAELVEFGRANLAHFKAPKQYHFELLPRTSTGKVQKFALRNKT